MARNEAGEKRQGPVARWQFGAVSASVFENEVQRADGSCFRLQRVVLQKCYRDGSGQFKTANSLDVNDLPRAILALQKAFEHCLSVDRQEGSVE